MGVPTNIATQDSSQAGGLAGGRLVGIRSPAKDEGLEFDAEATYDHVDSMPTEDFADFGMEALHDLQKEARTLMDCQICFNIFLEPMTTACGHTFCRSCLQRTLDHSRCCPVCRRKLAMNPILNHTICPSNERLTTVIDTFWGNDLRSRKEIPVPAFDVSLFVCTISFPTMPTFLHIFEPRYRLMIRRALDSDRTFGMVLPKRPEHPGDAPFHEYGTLLHITNAHYYPDGRCLIEARGMSRFRVISHSELDGYVVGNIERVDDVSLEDEEAGEASEVLPAGGEEDDSGSDESPIESERKCRGPETVAAIETMSTRSLMSFAQDFVERMKAQNVPWLNERMFALFGECPTDPALLPWWLACMLPVRESEKYRLLQTSSVRERLKTCGAWVIEWETQTW